jgi:hypothetical protein
MKTGLPRIVLMTATLQTLVLWMRGRLRPGLIPGKAPAANEWPRHDDGRCFPCLSVVLGPLLLGLDRYMRIIHETAAYVGDALARCSLQTAAASLLVISVVFGAPVAGS